MPQRRVKGPDGIVRVFPADATDAEIAAALGGSPHQTVNVDEEIAAAQKLLDAQKAKRTWTDVAVDAIPTVAGGVGSVVGGIGGTVGGFGVGGVPGAIGGATLGGAAGESARQIINRLRGADAPATPLEAATDIGKEAALQGGTEVAGAGVGAALKATGKGLYLAALRPAEGLRRKYGNLVAAGLERALPVSKRGVRQTGELLEQSYKVPGDLAAAAGAAGTTVPRAEVVRGLRPVATEIGGREAAGVAGGFGDLADSIKLIVKRNPQDIDPTVTLARLRAANSAAETAYRAERAGQDVGARGLVNEGLADSWRQAFQNNVPGTAAAMAENKTLYGLNRAMDTAANRPHQLTNLMSVGTGVLGGTLAAPEMGSGKGAGTGAAMAALFRAGGSPLVQSLAGITADRASRLPYAQLLRLALIAGLRPREPQGQ